MKNTLLNKRSYSISSNLSKYLVLDIDGFLITSTIKRFSLLKEIDGEQVMSIQFSKDTKKDVRELNIQIENMNLFGERWR